MAKSCLSRFLQRVGAVLLMAKDLILGICLQLELINFLKYTEIAPQFVR